MHCKLDMGQTNLNSVRILAAQLSMEGFAGGNVGHLLGEPFNRLVTDVKNFFGSFNSNVPAVAITANQRNFLNELPKHKYLDISPLLAYIPEGLDTTYIKYAVILEKAAKHASLVLSGIMNDYSTHLGLLINNADSRLSTASFNIAHKALEEDRIKLISEMATCFKHGSTKAEVDVGCVVDRLSDWEKVFKVTDNLSHLINSVDRTVLNKKIIECTQYLDIILAKVKRGEMDNLSPEGLQDLSIGAYNVASELEFFSIVYYRILALLTAIDGTVKHFDTVFKK